MIDSYQNRWEEKSVRFQFKATVYKLGVWSHLMTPKQITGGAYEEHYLFLSEMIDVSSSVDDINSLLLNTENLLI